MAVSQKKPDTAGAAKILVVEDHEATREAVTLMLSTAFPGCQLLGADSAETALPLFDAELPTLVVMDIALPGMNGFEATRRIRERHPECLVVIHSSSDMPIYREESEAVGAVAFVSKGRTSRDLIQIASRYLPQSVQG
ncbi:MAG: response regulator transcription factor [Betaproteobacteria bacterium]|nr:response regulator transcription factor [Betaproteobacteria bacterium]MDE1981304.1 response regulator transcription factor [Betaproteobacteria bacterium]MDE2132333.1 response regulator transcription factor [Betaproteobacteria bacterium]MDE2212138.1 response regulator transcription factor [Betaproteobacteria bacterium]